MAVGVVYAGGVRAAGATGGIKASGRPDVALVVFDEPVAAAGVFTRNRVVAAPVAISRAHLERTGGWVRALVVQSGNANAATGARGLADAHAMAAAVAGELGEVAPEQVLVCSTGVIGVPLPMDAVRRGIGEAAASLGSEAEHGASAAEAIRTTDAGRKTAETWLAIGGGAVRIGGMAKGAGMIRPDLGTMICILTTDLVAEPGFLDDLLREAVEESFNAISVDGSCSTNDAVVLCATGRSGIRATSATARDAFADGLRDICRALAIAIVRDGEGARRYARWSITGATTRAEARTVARAIAEDQLVRCALHGADPNWGRILSAAGMAGVDIVPEAISISIGGVTVFDRGAPVDEPPGASLRVACEADEVRMHVDLGQGDASTTFWGSDLSADYVAFNSIYTT